MAYDAARKRVILFGGFDGRFLNDTWAFDGTTWTKLSPKTSPPARTEHAMAYDGGRKRIVLYGGWNRGLGFNDTWEWDGSTWIQRHPATRPPAMARHAMAYDAARRRIVIFGVGRSTWEWDGKTWTRRLPKVKPSMRESHAMVYDAARGRVLLFGGYSNSVQDDTWEWDGNNWTKRSPKVSPPARAWHSMAYDPVRRRTVLYGGGVAGRGFSDTWEWDGRTWSRQSSPAHPLATWGHAMAYEVARQRVVLFGGSSKTWPYTHNDTWEYAGTRLLASGTARPGSTVALSLHAPGNEGLPYQAGTSFGAGPMPIDQRWIELSPDTLLVVSTAGYWPWVFSGYRGAIDRSGAATASIRIPNVPALIGTRTHTAFVTLDPKAPSGISSISNTETVVVVK